MGPSPDRSVARESTLGAQDELVETLGPESWTVSHRASVRDDAWPGTVRRDAEHVYENPNPWPRGWFAG